MSRVSLFSAPFLLGFDAFEERVDRLSKAADGYPHYNIERATDADGTEKFLISIAVAGFSLGELDVIAEDNQLLVRGRQKDDPSREFLHRGIAGRSFERRFQLADYVEVTGADIKDGMLYIDLKREVPEKMKPRTIAIGGTSKSVETMIEHKQAA